jgi:hypothetical protein
MNGVSMRLHRDGMYHKSRLSQFVPALNVANDQLLRKAGLCVMVYANVLDRDLDDEAFSQRYLGWPNSVLETVVAGSPERCARVVNSLREAGASHIVLDFFRIMLLPFGKSHRQRKRHCAVSPLPTDRLATSITRG